MTEKAIINGVDVSECEQHCSDNHNKPNMCYQDMTGGYLMCQPKERQCNFYVTQIEQQLASKTEECEKLNKELSSNEKIINRLIKQSDSYKQALEEIKCHINKQCLKCRNSTLDDEYCVEEKCAVWEILQKCEVVNV